MYNLLEYSPRQWVGELGSRSYQLAIRGDVLFISRISYDPLYISSVSGSANSAVFLVIVLVLGTRVR